MYSHYWRTILINPFFPSSPPPPHSPKCGAWSLNCITGALWAKRVERGILSTFRARFAQNGRSPRLANKVLVIYASYDPGHRGRGKIRAHPSHSTTVPTSANIPSCKWKPTVLKISTARAIYIPTSIIQEDQEELNLSLSLPFKFCFLSFKIFIIHYKT